MFNFTVIKLKDVTRYLIGIMLMIAIIFYISKIFTSKNKEVNTNAIENKLSVHSFGSLTGCLDTTIPTIKMLNEEYNQMEKENEKDNSVSYLEEFLKTEISTIKGLEEIEKEDKKEETISSSIDNKGMQESEEKNEEITLADSSKMNTEVVTPNPIKENYNTQYENVKIKNETTYTLTQDMLNPDIKIDNKNILIFHTHSCESYTSSEKYSYNPTGNYRTTDLNYTVTRVGTELENYLKQYNINTIHDTSYHDYPAYNGSYTRSLNTVENILSTTSSDIIIDLHRDAIGSREDYAPTVKIGEDYAAQIMFVIGTNEGGLWHPNWNQNLKFAIKVQKKAEEMYPRII